MGRLSILLIMLAILCDAVAQDSFDYRIYKRFEAVEAEPLLVRDTLPEEPRKEYRSRRRIDDYNLSFVANLCRGRSFAERQVRLNGIAIPYTSSSRAYALRLANEYARGPAMRSHRVSATPSSIDYRFATFDEERTSVGMQLSSRRYIAAVEGSTSQLFDRGWSLSVDASVRTGRDSQIKGVYSSECDLGIHASKRIDSLHRLSAAFMVAPSESGSRRASTAEAYRLTGNHLYNPSWGYQAGKVRNANVRRELLPTLVFGYEGVLSPRLRLDVSAGAVVGQQRYSALEWYDASTPLPDNYRYMPSYITDAESANMLEALWRMGEASATQIDWDELYAVNRLGGGEAVYALADRVERIARVQLRGEVTAQVGRHGELVAAVDATVGDVRHYKEACDLLGADYLLDIDYFLLDDATYSNALQNNMHAPDRRVGVGDRFGYDYALAEQRCGCALLYRYHTPRLNVEVGAEVGYAAVRRRGYYRKELFADNSYGPSRRLQFNPYALRAAMRYAVAERHLLGISFATEGMPPSADALFLQADYNNRTVDNIGLCRSYDLEAEYAFSGENVGVEASAFMSVRRNERNVQHLYDDLLREYSDVVVSGINRLFCGVELLAWVRFARHWRAEASVVGGRYGYTSDALVELYADDDNMLLGRTNSRMKGLTVGNAPQLTLSAELSYYNRGWRVALSGGYAGLRYVAPSYTLRTERVLQLAQSPEAREQMLSQERLRGAATLNVSLSKRFYLRNMSRRPGADFRSTFLNRHSRSALTVSLSVRNLVGSRNMVYSGYESSRLFSYRLASDVSYMPQASRYMYAYPRAFYLAIRFSF